MTACQFRKLMRRAHARFQQNKNELGKKLEARALELGLVSRQSIGGLKGKRRRDLKDSTGAPNPEEDLDWMETEVFPENVRSRLRPHEEIE